MLDQSSTGDPTKPLSPSLRRRRFHERKVPIARRSSSMSIGDPTDTYRAVRPFKSVDYAYSDGREKKTIMVTDLDNAEVEMSKASRSTPNLSELSDWAGKHPIVPKSEVTVTPLTSDRSHDYNSASSVNAHLTIEESTAKIAAAVEDIDCVFRVAPNDQSELPRSSEGIPSGADETRLVDVRAEKESSVGIADTVQAEGESLSPNAAKVPLKSASASQVSP